MLGRIYPDTEIIYHDVVLNVINGDATFVKEIRLLNNATEDTHVGYQEDIVELKTVPFQDGFIQLAYSTMSKRIYISPKFGAS